MLVQMASAADFHVSPNGRDDNPGTRKAPLRTIQRAADLAQPGDTITVHAGTYRERINPPRGGASDRRRIVYRAAPGERVEIKGSEVVKGWTYAQDDTWKVTLPNTFFGNFNPYTNQLHGDWFDAKGRDHHTGAVYLNGDWLTEASTLEEVLRPAGDTPFWFGRVDDTHTTLWAQFKGVDPNAELVEINARQTVFYPDQPGRNYITVRGFTMRHAATPWAPPTAEQIGLIGTHWSKGWIIEDNVISHSLCSGISLGKHGDQFDNTEATAVGYVKTIERAHAFRIPWTREHIGHHIVRYNHISHCEQAGIAGSLGCAFSTVTGNTIHDIHVRRLFSGAEMAGIKFHGPSMLRSAGITYTAAPNSGYGWTGWRKARVSGNLFHENAVDLLAEVNHGPFLVDNNLFLSKANLADMSQGGAYAHNLFAGKISSRPVLGRKTPYHPAHFTMVAGLTNILGGGNRFHNNIFVGKGASAAEYGLSVYDARELPLQTGGNVYYNGAEPYKNETNHVARPDVDPKPQIVEESGRFVLQLQLGPELKQAATLPVTTALLGKAKIPNLPYENADSSPLKIDKDYFNKKRNRTHPTPGPFEKHDRGEVRLQVHRTALPCSDVRSRSATELHP